MKKLLLLLICLPLSVFAYVNDNGVYIDDDYYNNLRTIYSDNYIKVLTEDELNNLMDLGLDFDSVRKETLYFKSTENLITGIVTNQVVSKEEALSAASQYNNDRSIILTTTYKRLTLAIVMTTVDNFIVILDNQWLIMPQVRSFDVIAIRLANAREVEGTQTGKQIYTLNGNTTYINYSYNGTNINNQSNGFGISMNLVDTNVTYLECVITVSAYMTGNPAHIYASYQHATREVSLANSKDYVLALAGLGDVIDFNSDRIRGYYDGMDGLYNRVSI